MTTATTAENILRDVAMGDAPVLETLAEMHLDTFERSGLDPKTYFLVRLAALVAMDAAPASYLLALATADDAGVTVEDVKGTLAAVAPIVGSARVVSAASHTLRAMGLADLANEAAEALDQR
jgi:alkylhydroperoxidase/carboxymuconolactone decarboxylase family protein YurZ